MPEVNFLRENPVVGGMQQAQQLEAQQARADLARMQADGAREKMRQDRAASDALNQIWANGGTNLSSADVNRRLAQDPRLGGGRRLEALQTAETQDNQRTQTEAQARERQARMFKLYVDSGMFAAAAEESKRMGLNIPPQFWADREKVAALKQRLEIEDRQAGISQKRAAAGASTALAEERRRGGFNEYTDSENRVVRVPQRGGDSTYVTGPDGQPLRTAPKGGADGGRPSVYRERYDAWLRRHPGDEDGALRYAASERDATVAEKVKIARDMADKESAGLPSRFEPAYRKALESFGLDPNDPFGVRSRPQVRSQQQGQPQQGGEMPHVNGVPAPRSPAERDSLPRGTRYVDPNGQIRVTR